MRVIDRLGEVHGKLTVVARASNNKHGKARWVCQCACGNTAVVEGASLKTGKTTSCGCYRLQQNIAACKTHGGSYYPEYASWAGMFDRCTNVENPSYRNYGGRGLSVCEEWEDFHVFLESVGRRPTMAHSLDRIDNNIGYFPGNCRWATHKEQGRNRRTNHLMRYEGEHLPLICVAERSGISASSLSTRLRSGWTDEEAVLPRFASRPSRTYNVITTRTN